MIYWIFVCGCFLATMTPPTMADESACATREPAPGIDFRIPSDFGGKLVSIRANTDHHPGYTTQVFIQDASGQRSVPLRSARDSRWYGPERIIHEIDVRSPDGRGSLQVILTDDKGLRIQVIDDSNEIAWLRVSPDGKFVAFDRDPEDKFSRLEVHALPNGLEGSFPALGATQRHATADFSHPTWSPDSRLLAVARWETEATGRVYPRLAIYDHQKDTVRRIEDGLVPGKRDAGGTRPLVWTAEGLFAYSNEGILRCDPEGSGCTLFHALAADRFIHSAVTITGGKALLLLRDVAADPFENRAVEIHELDLKTGSARLLVRTPPGVFLESLDWIGTE